MTRIGLKISGSISTSNDIHITIRIRISISVGMYNVTGGSIRFNSNISRRSIISMSVSVRITVLISVLVVLRNSISIVV